MKPAQTLQTVIAPISWDELPLGRHYRNLLDRHLEQWWPKLFGQYLLKIGALSGELKTEKCTVLKQITLAPAGQHIDVIAEPHCLPFADKSIDICLLAHTLGYSSDPHAILREADRVLVDDGWLILSDFNPFSVLGLGRCIPFLNRRQPYCNRMFSMMRLVDWLHLLNYEIVLKSHFQWLPWYTKSYWLEKPLPVVGCLTLLIARKRTVPMTLSVHRSLLNQLIWRPIAGAAHSGQVRTSLRGDCYITIIDDCRVFSGFSSELVTASVLRMT